MFLQPCAAEFGVTATPCCLQKALGKQFHQSLIFCEAPTTKVPHTFAVVGKSLGFSKVRHEDVAPLLYPTVEAAGAAVVVPTLQSSRRMETSAAKRQPLNQELSKIFNELWDADVNRFVPGKDYTISLQGKADFVPQGDSASKPLFCNVNEQRLKNTETYSTFISLLDNYETSTNVPEVVTPEEIAENHRFLDAVLKTDVMKLAHQYLVEKKRAKPELENFKSQLYDIWFHLYTREGKGPNTCGFEHVFVGEIKRGYEILGLHNWVQFYLQEKLKCIDYKGYMARKNKSRPDEDDQVLSLQFGWKGLVKPLGSTFIGVSPEFELALYTIVFLESNEREIRRRVKIEEYDLEIVVYRHGQQIGSAYPVLLHIDHEGFY